MPGPTTIVDTEFGLARQSPTPGAVDKAMCHSHRPMFADGLCESCVEVRDRIDSARAMVAPDAQIVPSHEELTKRGQVVQLFKVVDFAEGLAEYARAIMVLALPEYAALHLKAARIAAEDGDAGPAEFALKYAKTLEMKKTVVEPEKAAAKGNGGGSGVTVKIGVALGGMPGQAQLSAQVVDVEAE